MNSAYKSLICIVIILAVTHTLTVARIECELDVALSMKCCNIIRLFKDNACFDHARHTKNASQAYCALGCYYGKHFGYKNYSLNFDMVDDFLDKLYPNRRDTYILIKIKNFYKDCQDKASVLSKYIESRPNTKISCSLFPAVFQNCLYYQSIVHCPKTRFNASAECFNYIENMRTCSFKEVLLHT